MHVNMQMLPTQRRALYGKPHFPLEEKEKKKQEILEKRQHFTTTSVPLIWGSIGTQSKNGIV